MLHTKRLWMVGLSLLMILAGLQVWAADVAVEYDTIATHSELYLPGGIITGEPVGLAVSNSGEVGHAGIGGANLDYTASGLECGTRPADAVYLYSGSPFVLEADDNGENVRLTCSYGSTEQLKPYAWVPTHPFEWRQIEFDAHECYGFENRDILWSRAVSPDGGLAVEVSYAVPGDGSGADFIFVITSVYPIDGQQHNNLTIGRVADWDIPSDLVQVNTSGMEPYGYLTYVQGTDTASSEACQSNTRRFAAEAEGSWSMRPDPCTWGGLFWGAWAGPQSLLEETDQARDGSPIDPPAPDAQAWRDEIEANPEYHGNPSAENQAVWLTVRHDFSLGAYDTLSFWTTYSTARDQSLFGFELQVWAASGWDFWYCYREMTCCQGARGNVNGDELDKVTIGDIAVLIDHLFVDRHEVNCVFEADVDQSGGTSPSQINPGSDITIGDVAYLTDYLFITGPEVGTLPCCP